MGDELRTHVATFCAKLPGAEVSDPWGGGHDAWKVGGRMFACIGAVTSGVSVKCPYIETADLLRDTGAAARAPHFHRSWVLLPEDVGRDDLAFRLTRSYDIVRASLPAAVRRAIPERPAET